MASSCGSSYASSLETTNYAHMCRIVVDVLRDILWQVLTNEILPTDLPQKVQIDIKKLGNLNLKLKTWLCGISPPSTEIPSTEKFDVSSLYTLIRNLCSQVPTPSTQWGQIPPAGGITLGDDIERIREFRNTLYGHATQAKIENANFNKLCIEIKDVASRFDAYFCSLSKAMKCDFQCGIDTILTSFMDKSLEDHYIEKMKEIAILSDVLVVVKQQVGDLTKKVDSVHDAIYDLQTEKDKVENTTDSLVYEERDCNENAGNSREDIALEMPQGMEGKICIIKCYANLKLELERDIVMDIAKRLFKKKKDTDVLEEIAKAETRRLCIDRLLKRVLQLEATGLKSFFDLLKMKCPEGAQKLTKIKVTDKEKENFTQVSISVKMVPPRIQNGLKFEQLDVEFFQCKLLDIPEKVDQIADVLLSQFHISICNHSRLMLYNDPVGKMHALLEKVQSCHFDSDSEVQSILGSSLYNGWQSFRDDGSRQANKAVSKGSKKLTGMDMDMDDKPCKPVSMYKDKLLITGLNEMITEDCLINFLEARGGVSPTETLYAEDDEKMALVSFGSPPDIQKLQDACQKKKLHGATLVISQVPISKCVLVTNLATKTFEDTVQLYFENARRSGGGSVEKVEMNKEAGECLIFFEDLSVVDSVLGRKHTLDNSEIQLQLFHPCIGRTTSFENRGKFQNPDSFVFKVNLHFIAFFKQVPNAMVRLEQELSKVHVRLVVPSGNSDTLEVFPTLKAETEGVKRLSKTWKDTAKQNLEAYMEQLDCSEHQVMPDLWASTVTSLQKVHIPKAEDVIVCADQQQNIIRVVGFKDMMSHVSNNLKQIICDGEKELELKKQQTSDRIILPQHEIYFLSAVNFPDKLHNICREVECTIQQEDNSIVFEGILQNIKQAQLLMFETIQTIAKSSMPDYSRSKMELLAMKETCDYIRQRLKENGCLGLWESDGNSVIVYDVCDQKANEGIQIIKKCLVENTINMTPEQSGVINSDAWNAMLADINRQHQGQTIIRALVQNSTIEITATDQYAGKIIESVQDFISANALYKKIVTVDLRKMRYLEQWKKPQINEICKSQQKNMVNIDLSKGVITLQGTQKGLREAEDKMSTLLKQMCCKQKSIEKPGIGKYLCSDKGEELIKHIENVNKCTIDLVNEEEVETSLEESQMELQKHLQHPVECLSCKMLGGRTMSVFHGDITDLDIHVLINPCNKMLDHSGGLAKAVVEKGGPVILSECSQLKRQKLMDGDVVYTKGGNLKCKIVAHGVSPIWQGGADNEEEYLKEVVLKSLEETDKKRLTSIGIPAIGTGIFGWPTSVATLVIVRTVQEYFQDNSNSVIKNVYLCDLDAEHLKAFIQAVKKAFPAGDLTFHEDPSQIATRGSPSVGTSSGESENISLSDSKSGSSPHRIKVVKGEMAHQQADALVNTTSNTLNLSHGAVSASLLAVGGQQLQDECKNKYPNGIKHGEVAITGAGELRSACVLHGCLPDWNDDGSTLLILKTFMNNCLSEADKKKLTSIAFPALGTGTLKYPKDVVAREMFNCVSDFLTKNADTSLVDVYFVVYQKDLETLMAFEKEEKEFLKRLSSPSKEDESAEHQKRRRHGRQSYSDVSTTSSKPQSSEFTHVPQVKIIPGDITMCSVDAIVNPTDATVCLDGGVSRAILRTAGAELKEMCSTLGKEMKKKGFVVTPGFNLACGCIIHVNVRSKQYGWKEIILKCLEESVKRKLRSIAFPALGTGNVGGNPEEIGKALFEATCEIIQAGSSTLQEIQMVVFQPEMVSKIEEGIKSAQESIPKTSSWIENIKGFFGYGKNPSSVQPHVLRDDGMKVFIYICADSENVIQDVLDNLESKFNKELEIDAITDDVIKRLSEDQVSEMERIGRKHHAQIKVEKRLGRVRIEGLLPDVGKVKSEVLNLMRGIEKMENKEKQAAMLSQLVQWYFIDITADGQDLVEYSKDMNATIEEAYQRKEKILRLQADVPIIIDFDTFEEYPITDPDDKVKVLRKDKIKDSVSEIPPEWDPMDKDNLKLILLQPASKEYTDVASLFMATVKKENASASVPIVKIERIQNRTLYAQYQSKKKLIDEMNPGQTNEMDLWHGTAGQAVDSINVHGFNRSFCGKNATMYGDGVYFAKESYYSARDLYSPLDAAGNKKMYLTKVLTGKYALGKQGMRVPPPLVPDRPELHDSVVDNINTPFIFVIFHDTQACPKYLITFKWN